MLVPNVVLILTALLLLWCWKRRQHRQLIEKAGFVPMKKDISRPQLQDPAALLTPSSTSTVIHPALRSHRPEFSDDTSIFTRPDRRSASAPQEHSSFTNIASDFLSRPLRRSISDNYITWRAFATLRLFREYTIHAQHYRDIDEEKRFRVAI